MELNSNPGLRTAEPSPLKTLKPRTYTLAVVALSLAMVFITVIGFLGYQVGRANEQLEAINRELDQVKEAASISGQICISKECIVSAASLLESMDLSADPCQDFYQFACGGWIDKHPLPDSHSRLNQFDVLGDQVTEVLRGILKEKSTAHDTRAINSSRAMYAACMNVERIEELGLSPLLELLGSHGHWPMTVSNWTADRFDWRSSVTSLRRVFGANYLIYIYNHLDSNDTDRSAIFIDQPTLALSRSTLLVDDNSTAAVITAYTEYATAAAKAIRDQLKSEVNDSSIAADVIDVIQFERELAKITTRPEERRNKTRMYNPLQLSELQRLTDSIQIRHPQRALINWTRLVNDIYSSVDVQVTEDELVVVVEVNYLLKLIRLIDTTPPRTVANYMLWRLVQEVGMETNQQMNYLSYEFFKVLYGTSEPQPRWRSCVNKVNNFLGFAISSKYIQKSFDEESKSQAEEMIGYLKRAFSSLVNESTWMDEPTKQAAREKAAAMKQFLAYPEWIRNETALDGYYKGLAEISTEHHFQNVRNAIRFLISEALKNLRKKTDHAMWITYPSIVNAYYSFKANSITFPAAILQPPFFGRDRLAAMNFGAIGVVIGHEITHGFDDQGRQSDKDGKTLSWWTNETLARYLDRAQCFVEQYGNFSLTLQAGANETRINGVISQGENIADNGGIREAYRAYQTFTAEHGPEKRLPGLEQYTAEQIFFISYASIWCGRETPERLKYQIQTGPHSPSRYRVLGPLSNSEDFVKLFKCPTGAMNRRNKCVLW